VLNELDILSRANALFAGSLEPCELIGRERGGAASTPGLPVAYLVRARKVQSDLEDARLSDTRMSTLLRRAH